MWMKYVYLVNISYLIRYDIYLLQLGFHLVEVVLTLIHKTQEQYYT